LEKDGIFTLSDSEFSIAPKLRNQQKTEEIEVPHLLNCVQYKRKYETTLDILLRVWMSRGSFGQVGL